MCEYIDSLVYTETTTTTTNIPKQVLAVFENGDLHR